MLPFDGDLAALVGRIMGALSDMMDKEVKEATFREMTDSMEEEVYSYDASPRAMGTRRYDFWGLLDENNFETDLKTEEKELTLRVYDVAGFQGTPVSYTDLADVVESGNPAFKQPYPRPFMATAEDKLEENRLLASVIENGLRARGLL